MVDGTLSHGRVGQIIWQNMWETRWVLAVQRGRGTVAELSKVKSVDFYSKHIRSEIQSKAGI